MQTRRRKCAGPKVCRKCDVGGQLGERHSNCLRKLERSWPRIQKAGTVLERHGSAFGSGRSAVSCHQCRRGLRGRNCGLNAQCHEQQRPFHAIDFLTPNVVSKARNSWYPNDRAGWWGLRYRPFSPSYIPKGNATLCWDTYCLCGHCAHRPVGKRVIDEWCVHAALEHAAPIWKNLLVGDGHRTTLNATCSAP